MYCINHQKSKQAGHYVQSDSASSQYELMHFALKSGFHILNCLMEAFYENMRKRILQKVNISANNNCWIRAVALDSEKKYDRICYFDPVSGESKRKNVSRVAYMVFHKEWGANPGLDCSHLCHNTLCCNPNRLVLEPRSINNNRNYCKNEMQF